MSFAPVVVHL